MTLTTYAVVVSDPGYFTGLDCIQHLTPDLDEARAVAACDFGDRVDIYRIFPDHYEWVETFVLNREEEANQMTDTPTTMSMLEEHELFTIEKMLDEYSDADNTIPKIAWVRVLSDYRTLQAKVAELEVENERLRDAKGSYVMNDKEQMKWDMISMELTIEELRNTISDLLNLIDEDFVNTTIVKHAKEKVDWCE
jgi:hypothetical protein